MKFHHSAVAVLALVVAIFSGTAFAQSSSSTSSSSSSGGPTPPGSGYIECAIQGAQCNFTGTATVVIGGCYTFSSGGATSGFCNASAPQKFTAGVLCDRAASFNNSGAGNLYASKDRCYYKLDGSSSSSSSSSGSSSGGCRQINEVGPLSFDPPGWTLCARRGEFCAFSGKKVASMGGTRTIGVTGCVLDGRDISSSFGPASQEFSNGFLCAPESFTASYAHPYACYVRSAANLALTATASASSQSGNSRTPAMTNDGNATTRWEASNSSKNSWLRLTLASPGSVQRVVLSEYGSKVKTFRVEYLSGSQWLTAASGNDIGSQKVISFTPVSTGSVRVVFTDLSGQPSISEFEVY